MTSVLIFILIIILGCIGFFEYLERSLIKIPWYRYILYGPLFWMLSVFVWLFEIDKDFEE